MRREFAIKLCEHCAVARIRRFLFAAIAGISGGPVKAIDEDNA
jgi:hypothetical protein